MRLRMARSESGEGPGVPGPPLLGPYFVAFAFS